MTTLFIAGAGTNVGKTYVTAGLIRRLRAAGRPVLAVKPVASGMPGLDDPALADSDPGRLLAAQGVAITPAALDACSPWRFAAPLAPDAAAAREGRRLVLDDLKRFHREARTRAGDGALLVEGVGGVMSPVTADALNLDWIAALGCPTLLVAGSYVGAISHALTALAALRERRLAVTGVVVSASDGSAASPAETASAIARWSGAPAGWLARATGPGTP